MKTENVTDSPGTTLEYRHSDALCWMLYTMGNRAGVRGGQEEEEGEEKGPQAAGRAAAGRGPGSAAIMIGLGRIARVAG